MTQQHLTYRPLPGTRLNMAHPLAEGLVLCMNFNEQGSRAMDLSPSGAHGRLSGFGSPAKRHIQGLDFVSANPSYVEIPAAFTQLDFTSEDFSLIMRQKFDSLKNNDVLFIRGFWLTDGWYINIDAAGTVWFNSFQFGFFQRTYTAVGAVATDTWYTLGFSRSGTSVRIYRNAVDVSDTIGVHQNFDTCARSAKIGIYDNLAQDKLDGKMEFLRVFRGIALTEAQHKAIHEQPNAPYGYPLFI